MRTTSLIGRIYFSGRYPSIFRQMLIDLSKTREKIFSYVNIRKEAYASFLILR